MDTIGIVSVTSVFAMTASANNYQDTDDWYHVGGYSFDYTKAARVKEDYTSSYQKCIYTTVPYNSWVYGTWKPDPDNMFNDMICEPKEPGTGRSTPRYWFDTGVTYYMVNFVRENGLPYAGMMLFAGWHSGTTHIRWSPDSI